MKKNQTGFSKEGEFLFSGFNTLDLASEFGTPLYVMSQDVIEDRVGQLKQAFEKTGCNYEICFAGKSFLNKAMAKLIEQLDLKLDVVSLGELMTGIEAGIKPQNMILHGSNKSIEELEAALDYNIHRIIVDNIEELAILNNLAQTKGKKANILIRVNPGVEAHVNEMINTGKIDTKFGIPLSEIPETLQNFSNYPNLNLKGFHFHVGSQIIEEKPFLEASKKVFALFKEAEKLGINLTELNLGGGFGIAYTVKEKNFSPENLIPKLVEGLRRQAQHENLALPLISIEPGRFISAPAGITLYTVGTIKDIPGIRTYLSVDGGLADNPRPALYDAEYEALICNRPLTEENGKTVRVSGKSCETDLLIDEITLASPQRGDILAVFNTGAYNYSMASQYNRVPKPAVVLLNKNDCALMVERESIEDLLRKDRMPYWLV